MRKLFTLTLFLIAFLQIAYSGSDPGANNPDWLVNQNPNALDDWFRKHPGKKISRGEYLLLLATDYENIGKYIPSDSLIQLGFKTINFKNDSQLYYRFHRLNAENKKVQNQLEEALRSLAIMEDYSERNKNITELIDTYLLFAEHFRATSTYDKALEFLEKARSVNLTWPKGIAPQLVMRYYNRKAAIFIEQAAKLDSAEKLLKYTIELAKQANDMHQLAVSSNDLGYLYHNTKNEKAEYHFRTAIDIWEKLGYGIYSNSAKLNLARFYLNFGKPRLAGELCIENLEVVKKNAWTWRLGPWYEVLAFSYENRGDYENAFYYMKLAKNNLMRDAYSQFAERLAYYANKLELKNKQEELLQKNNEVLATNRALESQTRANRNMLYSLVALISVLVVIGSVTLIINRQKKLLDDQRTKIISINNELNELIKQKEVLLQEVNHRVKNNLGMLSSLLYLKEKEALNKDVVKSLRETQGRIHTISIIHETLINRNDMEQVDFQDYLTKLTGYMRKAYSLSDEVHFKIQCIGFSPSLSTAFPLAMMCNELITNSIKYAFPRINEPMITIDFDREKSVLSYSDNGPGYDPEKVISSTGKNLISIFAKQIGARLDFLLSGNTVITLIQLKPAKKLT